MLTAAPDDAMTSLAETLAAIERPLPGVNASQSAAVPSRPT